MFWFLVFCPFAAMSQKYKIIVVFQDFFKISRKPEQRNLLKKTSLLFLPMNKSISGMSNGFLFAGEGFQPGGVAQRGVQHPEGVVVVRLQGDQRAGIFFHFHGIREIIKIINIDNFDNFSAGNDSYGRHLRSVRGNACLLPRGAARPVAIIGWPRWGSGGKRKDMIQTHPPRLRRGRL